MTKTLAKIIASIPVRDRPFRRRPSLTRRKPTDARTCACGSHVFANTTFCWIAIVDAEDGWLLRDYKWRATASGGTLNSNFYAASARYGQETGLSTRLHRAVMGHPHEEYDHANGNGHDCRKANLRPCTNSQNCWNQKPQRSGGSKYKGVAQNGIRWEARIKVYGQPLYLGRFGFESDAAICYNYHAAHYFGEFARLNKITEFMHD